MINDGRIYLMIGSTNYFLCLSLS